MTHHTQLEDKLGGDDKFRAWMYIISSILGENDLDRYINGEVLELVGDEAKDKRTIAYSIKDHLIPHVSTFKTPKEVYDSLKKMFKGKKINQKMTLRNHIKNMKIQNFKTIQSHFTRVSQIKEQLEPIEENVKEG